MENEIDYTTVSLHEHIDTEIKALDTILSNRLDSQDKALVVALQALNDRLAGMNEFRETLRDQASRLATREYVEGIEKRTSDEIKRLQINEAVVAGKASQAQLLVSYVIGFSSLALSIASFLINR